MAGANPSLESGASASTLQFYNNDMVKCIDDLCSRRDDINKQLKEDFDEKDRLHNDIRILTTRLAKLNELIAQRMASRIEFDKNIVEVQAAYTKIMDTSQSLIQSVRGASLQLKLKEAVASGNESILKLPKAGGKRDLTSRK